VQLLDDAPHSLTVAAPDLDAALRALVAAKVAVRHVEPVGRRLETMFLEETRERPATAPEEGATT